MTWRHYEHRRKDGRLFQEWYFADLGFASFSIVWDVTCPHWRMSLSCKADDFDDLANRIFNTAEDAMAVVESSLASLAQGLLSDALGVRRIQEAQK